MRINFNIPLGVPNLGTPFKCFWQGAAAAGVSVLGSLSGGMIGSGMTKSQQRLQSRLNKDEMAYSQSLNKSYQEYLNNTMYGAQAAGMKNAGINPAANPGGVSGATGSNGLSTGPSGPAGPNLTGLGSDAVQAYLGAEKTSSDIDLQDSQTKLNNETANKIKEETAGQKIINEQLPEQLKQGIEELKARAAELWSRKDLNGSKITEIEKNIEVMSKSIDQMTEQIENLKQERNESKAREGYYGSMQLFTDKQRSTWDRFISAQIKHYLAQANLLNGQNAREGQMLLFNMSSAAALADYYDQMTRNGRNQFKLLGIQAEWNQFLMEQDRSWNEFTHWLNAGTQVFNCIGDNFYKIANGISSFVPFTSHSASFGYTPFGAYQNHTDTYRAPVWNLAGAGK